jgi:BMFP domain-containing protein YqiC
MQFDNRLLDDFARVTSGALGMMARLKDEVAVLVRQQMDNILGRMELVSREEFEAVKEMAAKARAEQEKLTERLAELESRLGPSGKEHAKEHAKKPQKGEPAP